MRPFLARCRLDTNDPKFRKLGRTSKADLESGLAELRDKLAKDHRLSGFFPHQMPGFPQYQNKIWEWDFAPSGDRSRTRKGWRLFAYVPDHNAPEPIPVTAMVAFDKSDAPTGDYAIFLAGILKEFLAQTIEIKAKEDRFRRQVDGEGRTISLCLECYVRVATSDDVMEVELAEDTHACESSGTLDLAASAEDK